MKDQFKIDLSEGYDWGPALMNAAKKGHVNRVDFFLQRGLIDACRDAHKLLQALRLASQNGHVDFIKFLQDKGLVDGINAMDTLAACLDNAECLRCFLDIVVTDEIPTPDANQDARSSTSLFAPNDSGTWFTYAPGIRWRPPYVYDGDQPGQSVLKLIIGRGLGRCLVCFLVGNLDVTLDTNSVCHHEGLEQAALKETESFWAERRFNNYNSLSYIMQYERICFNALTVLLREEYMNTGKISLHLHRTLRSKIKDSNQVDYCLRMLCDGSHFDDVKCVDFLVTALVCQERDLRDAILKNAVSTRNWRCLQLLLQNMLVQDGRHPLEDAARKLFVELEDHCMALSHKDGQKHLLSEALCSLLSNGVFRWSLYPQVRRFKCLARALVINGYPPDEFDYGGLSSSPLLHAFAVGDEGLVRYLVANAYLTSRDMIRLQGDRMTQSDDDQLNGLDSRQRLYRHLRASLWNLQTLCLVRVSTLLGCQVRRKDNGFGPSIDALPLPPVFKRRLRFACPVSLTPDEDWDSIDIQPYI